MAEVYEELEPVIRELEKPEFMSRHLAREVDIPKSTIGEALSNAATDSSYEIEIVEKWPYRFSNPFLERSDGRKISDIRDKEKKYVIERASQVMDAKKEFGESEIYKDELYGIFDHFLEYHDLPTKYRKMAELEETLEEIDYITTESGKSGDKAFISDLDT